MGNPGHIYRQNEEAGWGDIPMRWKSVWWGMLDRCRDHRCLTKCHEQHRQNEVASQVDIIPTRVKIHMMGDAGHM